MIDQNEVYVDFAIAKLLRKAGFNWECSHFYQVIPGTDDVLYPSMKEGWEEALYPAPSLYVAQRWLRETKNFCVQPVVYCNMHYKDGTYSLMYYDKFVSYNAIDRHDEDPYWNGSQFSFKGYKTYEEATKSAIKRCLTIIIERMEKQ